MRERQGKTIPANTYHVGGNMIQWTSYGEPGVRCSSSVFYD
jgi:hypothetical protein